ncbi:hypothetical protein CYMTET_8615 [Cymbomonas tetramitiformis]|uniref:Cyclic nucleotide-binding domain-containing protein n=1 Tax=Cymbomonas tetramitiformis TaxID=36881 RepID=A0AAE0GSY3_9CHLO|nr:hypothetical protein CYMTET_8615 [Cymbomonas tetramitiformis]
MKLEEIPQETPEADRLGVEDENLLPNHTPTSKLYASYHSPDDDDSVLIDPPLKPLRISTELSRVTMDTSKNLLSHGPKTYSMSPRCQDDHKCLDTPETKKLDRRRENQIAAVSGTPPFWDSAKQLINPKCSFMSYWDLNTTVLLVFTAIVTPFEVGFLETNIGPLFVINRYVDLCFFLDIIFAFFLPFTNAKGVVISLKPLIRKRYVKGWFIIDVVSIIPFDIINLTSSSGSVQNLKVLRAVRLMRLAGLLRVLRGMRLFKRWESRISINYALMNLLLLMFGLLFGAHLMACLWAMILNSENADWEKAFKVLSDSPTEWDKYLVCVYWSIGMVTGCEDVTILMLKGYFQRIMYIVAMLLLGIAKAYLIGGVVGALESLNERKAGFYRAMDTLNSFLREQGLDKSTQVVTVDDRELNGMDLCERLRTYYIFKHSQGELSESFNRIIFTCSRYVQTAVAMQLYERELRNISFFEKGSDQLILHLAQNVKTKIFASRETIVHKNTRVNNLYIVERGSLFAKGRVLRPGNTFGEEVFYYKDSSSVYGYTVVSMTESVVQYIERKDLLEALFLYGDGIVQTRLLITQAVVRMWSVVKRAAKHAISSQSMEKGYEVLRTEYRDDILEIPDSPILLAWELNLENSLRQISAAIGDRKSFSHRPSGARPSSSPRRRTPTAIMSEFEVGREADAMRYAMHSYENMVELLHEHKFKNKEFVFLMYTAMKKYLELIAIRADRAQIARDKLTRDGEHLNIVLATDKLFDGKSMIKYHSILYDEQRLNTYTIVRCKAGDLARSGIPLGDAVRLLTGFKRFHEDIGTIGGRVSKSGYIDISVDRYSTLKEKLEGLVRPDNVPQLKLESIPSVPNDSADDVPTTYLTPTAQWHEM